MQQARSLFLGSIIFFLLVLAVGSFSAETEDPIRNGGGAMPLGIGHAVTASLNDINSAFYNPAGLMGMKSAQFLGMYYTKVYGNYHYFVAGGAAPTQYGVLGAGFISSGIGQVPVTTTGTDLAYAEYTDNLIFITYADSLKDLNPGLNNVFYGLNLKFFSKGTSGSLSYTATGTNADLGFKYVPYPWLSFGLTKQNVFGGEIGWDTGHKETYPTPTFIGTAYRDDATEITYSFDTEFPSSLNSPTLYHLGAERHINKLFAVRIGFDQIHDSTLNKVYTNPALGVGIMLRGISIDYAFHPYYEDQGYNSHFVSLSFANDIESRVSARAGTRNKIAYLAEEPIPLTVRMPFEANSVFATSPNDERIELSYDKGLDAWVGSWISPKDFKSASYQFTVDVKDLEGRVEIAQTNDIFIKETVTEASIEPCPINIEGYILYSPNDKIYTYDEVAVPWAFKRPSFDRVYIDATLATTDGCGEFKAEVPQKFGMNVNMISISSNESLQALFKRDIVRFYIPEDLTMTQMETKDLSYKVTCEEIRKYLGKRYSTDKPLTRELLALIIAKAKKLPMNDLPAPKGKDIVKGYWAEKFISAAEKSALMENYPDGTFKTDLIATRSQLDKAFSYSRGSEEAKTNDPSVNFGDMINMLEASGFLEQEVRDHKAFLGIK